MMDIANWVHHTPSLLIQGRTKHREVQPGPGEEDIEPEVLAAREVERDPWEPRLKPIASDNAAKGGIAPWVLRHYGTDSELADPRTGRSVNFGTVVVKSMWWPGFSSFYNNGRVQSIYVGDGMKNEPANATYFPVNPPKMLEDRAERPTQ